jgi:hypothetical protein
MKSSYNSLIWQKVDQKNSLTIFSPPSPDICAEKFPLGSMGGRADRQECTDGERGPPSVQAEIFLVFSILLNVFSWSICFTGMILKKVFLQISPIFKKHSDITYIYRFHRSKGVSPIVQGLKLCIHTNHIQKSPHEVFQFRHHSSNYTFNIEIVPSYRSVFSVALSFLFMF